MPSVTKVAGIKHLTDASQSYGRDEKPQARRDEGCAPRKAPRAFGWRAAGSWEQNPWLNNLRAGVLVCRELACVCPWNITANRHGLACSVLIHPQGDLYCGARCLHHPSRSWSGGAHRRLKFKMTCSRDEPTGKVASI